MEQTRTDLSDGILTITLAAHPMEAYRLDSRAIWAPGSSGDAREGVQAFIDKRPARFIDHVSEAWPQFAPWLQDPRWDAKT